MGARKPLLADAAVVLGAAWIARLAFILAIPSTAHSADVDHWTTVAEALRNGANPYQVTNYLNWPPVWMQIVYVLSAISSALDVPFLPVLQAFLVAVESVLVVALLELIKAVAPDVNARVLVLWGVALNPVAILLVCQHGNFDVLVALLVVLFLGSLIAFVRRGDPVDWLVAGLFLGIGIAVKTIPLILTPLLATRSRALPWKTRGLGVALLLGPVALGMSVIYVLTPAEVTAYVLSYRSYSGWFGLSGLLLMAGASASLPAYGLVFDLLLAASMAASAWFVWRRDRIDARELVLLAALLLAAVPALGPGYSPQYIDWFLPLLVVAFAAFGGPLRWVLGGFALIAAATYLVEYALFPSHGMFLTRMTKSEPFMTWSRTWSTQTGQTIIRLPLFVAYAAFLAVGTLELRRRWGGKEPIDL